jgi:CRP-like cAMP-binding protein
MHQKKNEGIQKWSAFGGHSPFVNLFRLFYPLKPSIIGYIDEVTYCCSAAKGQFLDRPGRPSNHLYLICKGVIRGYRQFGKKEITTWINEENEIVGTIQNLGLREKPSAEYIQVIEDAELVALPNQSVELMYQRFPAANTIGRLILEESYRAAEERAFICRLPSAQMRYRLFLEQTPHLVNRIPLKYIASYLGITLETLSRLRNQRSRSK